MLNEILELYEYNRWANSRVRGATSSLTSAEFTRDLKSSFPSVRATLVHILSAEWIWFSRWKGVSPAAMLDPREFHTHDDVWRRWEEVERNQDRFLKGVDEERLHEIVRYRNTKGEHMAYPLWTQMRHLVNHSSYHRGQVTTMLRQLGHVPLATDLLVYYEQKG